MIKNTVDQDLVDSSLSLSTLNNYSISQIQDRAPLLAPQFYKGFTATAYYIFKRLRVASNDVVVMLLLVELPQQLHVWFRHSRI